MPRYVHITRLFPRGHRHGSVFKSWCGNFTPGSGFQSVQLVNRHLEILAQDVRYAARSLRRLPMFTMAAVFAMAAGTGAGTAVFSVVDRILFRSLPYRDAGRLVSLGMTAPIAAQEFLLGYDYLDWRDRQTPFESIGYWAGVNDCDLADTNPVRLRCAAVASSLLP